MQQGIGRKIVIAVGMLVVAGLLIVLYQWGNAREDTSKDRKSTRLNSSHYQQSRMPSSA